MATYGSNVAQTSASVNKDLLEDSDTQYSIIKADDGCQYVKADRSMASDGWKQRKAYFLDFDGKYYDVRISVAAGKDGDVVYHVGQMKERSFPYSHGSSTRSGAQFRETSLRASTVAQSPASVNKKDLTDSDQ